MSIKFKLKKGDEVIVLLVKIKVKQEKYKDDTKTNESNSFRNK